MDDGSSFDDVILQVFEEHVDKFTFPLATHKEARDFVRLLNRKGVTYEMVAEEVDEKLNYFENWRLISGEDNAIGNKVLKRLNEPLQDTMGEDDEDNDAEMDKVKQLLFNGRSVDLDDDAAEATLKALDEKRHSKALEAIREAEKQKASEAKETEAKKAAEAKEAQAKKAAEAKEAQAKKAAEAKETEAKRAAEAKETEAKKATEAKEIEAKKAEVKKAEAKKESVESDNKVTKKQEEKTKPDAKVSSAETGNKEKANNTSVKPSSKQESERVAKEPTTLVKENKSDSSTPTEKPTTAKSSIEEKVTAKVEDKSKTSTTAPEKSIVKKAEDSKATTSSSETSNPSKSDKEPPNSSVTVLKSVGSPASTASSSKPDNTKQPTSPSNTPPSVKTTESKDSSKSSETPPSTKSVNGVTGTADAKPATISLKVPSEPAKSDASSPTSPSTPASKSTPTPTTPSTPDTNLNLTPPGEINENYDSDLDGEEAGYKSDQAKLIDAVIKFKGAVKDGPGYVYILSDTTGSKPVADLTGIHRVRIGASRFPQKRAKQASTFNPDLKLVTSKHVTHRKASLSKIQEELSSMLYRGTPFWYRGAIDKILEALEALI